MQLKCPYCEFGMSLKTAKPGKFKPSCKKCKRTFLLMISEDGKRAKIHKLLDKKKVPENPPAPAPVTTDAAHEKETEPDLPAPNETAPNATGQDETDPSYEQTMESAAIHRAAETIPDQGDVAATPASPPATESESDFEYEQTLASEAGVAGPTAIDGAANANARDANAPPKQASTKQSRAPIDSQEETYVSRAQRGTMGADQPSNGVELSMPESLGGYNLINELGRGAMGAVYLARQVSLNRLVALKTMQAKWLANPVMLARFTREAYAAAQLTHHNVVQVYDLGKDRGTTFFSMEYVKGQSLSELVRSNGRVAPEQAASYILQAARGLRFAHSHGMVHRDIKPGNLMLNEEQVVKVADLGLVKVPLGDDKIDAAEVDYEDSEAMGRSAELTMAGYALGTAAYMAPEQAANSKGVDHRADIYALGCSMYVLLTAKPPFRGKSAMEVLSKHKRQAIVPPDVIVEELSSELTEIVMKMVAKKPDDRYQSMDEVIVDLERFLGISQSEDFKPTEEHANRLRACVEVFSRDKTAKFRSLALFGVAGISILLGIVMMLISSRVAIGLFAVAPLTFGFYFVLNGIREQSVLFKKFWQFVRAANFTDWIAWSVGALIALVVLLLITGLFAGTFIVMLAVGIAAAIHFVFDRKIRSNRQASLLQANELFRSMRLAGIEEADLREFVARFGGNSWEELFEELFGYDEKLAAREMLREQELDRGHKRFKPWRDKLIKRFDTSIEARRQDKHKEVLQEVEAAGLEAEGVDATAARMQARTIAESIIQDAEVQRDAIIQAAHAQANQVDPAVAAQAKRDRIKAMLAEARGGATPKPPGLFERLNGPLNLIAGAATRFLLGACLLAGCLFWLNQNELLSLALFEELWNAILAKAESVSSQGTSAVAVDNGSDGASSPTGISAGTKNVLPALTIGFAGIVLLLSSLFRGWKMSLFVIPGALIMIIGAGFATPILGPLLGYGAAIGAGTLFAMLGYIFGRTYDW